MKRMVAAGAALIVASGSGVVAATNAGAIGSEATAPSAKQARAVMKDPEGKKIAQVTFRNRGKVTDVVAVFRKSSYIEAGFHGFHVHANDLDAAGSGCDADPDAASSTWFVSADGHLADAGESHPKHSGDMPSVYTLANGKARAAFTIDKIPMDRLRGAAVMLHANPDNFGNIPASDYPAVSDEAKAKTASTGNAGDRIACGVIRR